MYTAQYAAAGLSRADHAYAELKRGLLIGDFAVNVRMGEERLAQMIGVSRTPIREALLRLQSEGLVSRWVDGGFRPVTPDVAVMREIYEVRSVLEVAALRRPDEYGAPHDRSLLEDLRADWATLREDELHEPDPGFVAMDEAFHLTVAESAGNLVLVEQLQVLNDRIRTVRMQDFMVERRIATTITEHLEILDVLLDGDRTRAQQLVLAHIGVSVAVIEDRVQRVISRMVTGVDDQ